MIGVKVTFEFLDQAIQIGLAVGTSGKQDREQSQQLM